MGNPKRYSKEFQERAVRRMKLGENVSQLARDLGVHRTCLYHWKRKLGRGPYHHGRAAGADWRDARIEELEGKVTRLEGIIGGQWQELDFFASALRRIDADGGSVTYSILYDFRPEPSAAAILRMFAMVTWSGPHIPSISCMKS